MEVANSASNVNLDELHRLLCHKIIGILQDLGWIASVGRFRNILSEGHKYGCRVKRAILAGPMNFYYREMRLHPFSLGL